MREDIKEAIKSCRECERFVARNDGFHPARSVEADKPGDHYQCDLAQLPESTEGHKYCLVMVDVFTGFIMLVPIKDKEAPTVARAIWTIWSIIGIPKISTDNGKEFVISI